MRFLDRLANRLLLRSDRAKTLLTRAGDVIRENRGKLTDTEQLMVDELRIAQGTLMRRMNEMLDIRRAELACINPRLAESTADTGPVETATQFKERLWELEIALEDRGWQREMALSNIEFSRYGVQQLIRILRIYALKNPLIKRGAIICRLYVFGRGVEIRSENQAQNDCIQNFLAQNKQILGHTGLASLEQDIQTDGTLYFGLPTDGAGNVTVTMIDPMEIMECVASPDDSSKPLYFLRHWTRQELDLDSGIPVPTPKKCWYPALDLYEKPPKQQPKTIGGIEVNWSMPIMRSRDSETPSKWRWAVPPLYSALDWASAYRDFLQDWATVQRSLSRFALIVETKGGQGAIASYQALLQTTFADSDGTQIEKNPAPVAGAAHVSGPGNVIQPFKSAGAQTAPEQSRRMMLMVASALGLPETFFGDASTGSLATAQSLDRPTELKFTEIQKRWKYDLERMLRYVLQVSKSTPGSRMREAAAQAGAQPQIIIQFPNVVEHNIQTMIQSIIEIGTGGGRNGIFAGIIDRRTIVDLCLAEIGYEKRQDLLDKIFGTNYDPAKDVTDQRSQVSPQMISQPLGKPLTDLSTPPPLPAPPAPVAAPPKPGVPRGTLPQHEPPPPSNGAVNGKTATKEALQLLEKAMEVWNA